MFIGYRKRFEVLCGLGELSENVTGGSFPHYDAGMYWSRRMVNTMRPVGPTLGRSIEEEVKNAKKRRSREKR